MARLAVLIHGMWGTSGVWHRWRPFLEERGWQTVAHSLRRHDAPPVALGETSPLDDVADLERTIVALPEKPVVIGHSMGGLMALLMCARGLAPAGVPLTPSPSAILAIRPTNTAARAMSVKEHSAFVPESGRVLPEIGRPWSDRAMAAKVNSRCV